MRAPKPFSVATLGVCVCAVALAAPACGGDDANAGGAGGTADPTDAAAAEVDARPGDLFVAGMEHAGTAGKLSVSIDAATPAPPQRDLNTWEVTVRDAARAPVSGCDIAVSLYMPAHMHNSPTVPTVTPGAGPGQYRVESIDFIMPQLWEVTFDLVCGALTDRVAYSFWIER